MAISGAEHSTAAPYARKRLPVSASRRHEISYLEAENDGPCVVLIHGFASQAENDWGRSAWIEVLHKAGFHVIAPDSRGHGQSAKPRSRIDYTLVSLADDVCELVVRGNRPAALVGYSMGSHVALQAALNDPTSVTRLVLGGLGENIAYTVGLDRCFADALDSDDPGSISDPRAAAMRRFAIAHGNDLPALAACLRGQAMPFPRAWLSKIAVPALVAAGAADRLAGSPESVAAAIPLGRAVTIPAATHANALYSAEFRDLAIAFLAGKSS